MDNLRIFLWVGLGLMLWLTIQAWQRDYGAPPEVPASEAPAGETPAAEAGPAKPESPPATLPAGLDEPPALPEAPAAKPAPEPEEAAGATRATGENGETIAVQTDVFDLKISLQGGDIRAASLPEYPLHKDRPDVPVTLLTGEGKELFVFRSGLRAAGGRAEPNHLATYSAPQRKYVLDDTADELAVTLTWSGEPGIVVEKTYRFRRGRYDIGLEYTIRNTSDKPYRVVSYVQILRRHNPLKRTMFNIDSYSFTGPVAYDSEKYEKLKPDDLIEEPYEASLAGGWVASIQHHFLAAAIPAPGKVVNYSATFDGDVYLLSAIDNEFVTVPTDESRELSDKLFIGPKLQSQLGETAEGLKLTVDYGVLTLLAQPLFWLLQKVHALVGNWGWSIILVTLMIKLVFYKLTETSGRSMAKMRKLQPRLKALQERYKDDREAMSRALMDLYKREKVNPAAGCLPMLIQIPFFIAFYWVLLESVEMRQAPFMLWITDLSSRDPYFVLPLLMGAAMFFQQRLNPAPPDPIQAKVMQFLPVMFTVFFAFFPAGLVLYWLTNSVLSMLQQWRINKVLGAA